MARPVGPAVLRTRSAHAETITPTAGGSAFTDEQKKALGEIIKDYLVKNPEVMIDVQNALDEKVEKQQSAKLKSFMAENGKSIYRAPNSSVAGDADGDITVVEFFDFNCGYCKRGLPEVQKLIQDDKKVRFVFKELPILCEGLGGSRQGRLGRQASGQVLGIPPGHARLQRPSQRGVGTQGRRRLSVSIWTSSRPTWQATRSRPSSDDMKALASKIGVNGTPHFLVGDKSIPGAPEDLHDQLETLVTEFRKDGCPTC